MGHVWVEAKIAGPNKERTIKRRMLVDTGATYACIPHQMARELGLRPELETDVTLADGRKVKAGMALGYVEINGRESAIQLLVFDVSEPLIGAFTLEALGLGVDPVSGELKPTRSFIARV